MQVTVNVAKPILQWILNNVQLDTLPPQVAKHLITWNSGEKEPTYNQIEKVSQSTGIPLGYFFLQTPPEEDIPLLEFRTLNSQTYDNPSRELIDTVHDMDQVQEWTRNHMKSEGDAPLGFIGMLKSGMIARDAASDIRKLLGIQENWYAQRKSASDSIRFLRSLISDLGVLVMMSGIVGNNTHRPLNISEFRAFAIVDEYAPLIFLNSNDSVNGRLFSLLHEFIHICLGEDDLFNDRDSTAFGIRHVETFCNAVTAELLVPMSCFVESWNSYINEYDEGQTIDILAKEYRCGMTVIARRALDAGFISAAVYQQIAKLAIKLYNDKKKKDKEEGNGGGDFYRTASSRIDGRFFEMLSNSVAAGRTLYSETFRLTNTNRSTFFKLADTKMGGGM